MRVRALDDADRPWVRRIIDETWGLPVVTPADVYDAPELLDGVVADSDGEPVGAITYRVDGPEWEIVTVHTTRPGLGIGRLMMEEVHRRSLAAGATRVWLITTDDNVTAMGFYERLGMTRIRDHPGFAARVRVHKPALDPAPFDAAIEYEWRPDPTTTG